GGEVDQLQAAYVHRRFGRLQMQGRCVHAAEVNHDVLLADAASRRVRSSSSTRSFLDSLPTAVFGSSPRISIAPTISCLPSRSLRNSLSSSSVNLDAPSFNLMKALGDWPRYSSGMPITHTSAMSGCSY